MKKVSLIYGLSIILMLIALNLSISTYPNIALDAQSLTIQSTIEQLHVQGADVSTLNSEFQALIIGQKRQFAFLERRQQHLFWVCIVFYLIIMAYVFFYKRRKRAEQNAEANG